MDERGPGGRGPVRPAERYGDVPRPGRRRALRLALAALGAGLVALTAWIGWGIASSGVSAVAIGFGDITDASVRIRFEVVKDADARVVCTVRAVDRDRVTVGSSEVVLEPPRYGERALVAVVVETSRRPGSAELVGCEEVGEVAVDR